ncbi:hypothetical protein C7447_103169 [Tenacibaculum adriaticum]|uniref:Uncharacterized protein n=1 Tax=Tenacibaculum adriaticum TaxID=413713 RepID=A0A5S5DQ29_9FLAO|nr:hypothetical protein [Tenacibaculum adriaticum]TYP98001.1 hypothetical protein C7447_103169 [Tenacibaculum adriaticum]
MEYLLTHKQIEDKSIVWFSKKNQYVVLENKTADILNDIDSGVSIKNIGKQLADEMDIPHEKAIDFVINIEQKLYIPNATKETNFPHDYKNIKANCEFKLTKYYKVNNLIFKVDFESENESFLIHPKFSHLEIKKTDEFNYNYQVFTENHHTFLLVDAIYIGSWHRKDIHYFQGKFSMQMVQHIHQKKEDKWLGIFHASAVSNTKNTILFLGDSGNGKSTSLALLQANGFTCIADDFVPVDVEKQHIYSFPSSISIKRNSLETLLPLYPELNNSKEYNFKSLNKVVRYLPPNTTDFKQHLPCKALVFIKYVPNSELIINRISNLDAFEKLVPDSWLSPITKNAKTFLDWFKKLPCYQLTYSDNKEMIMTTNKIFNNEL